MLLNILSDFFHNADDQCFLQLAFELVQRTTKRQKGIVTQRSIARRLVVAVASGVMWGLLLRGMHTQLNFLLYCHLSLCLYNKVFILIPPEFRSQCLILRWTEFEYQSSNMNRDISSDLQMIPVVGIKIIKPLTKPKLHIPNQQCNLSLIMCYYYAFICFLFSLSQNNILINFVKD